MGNKKPPRKAVNKLDKDYLLMCLSEFLRHVGEILLALTLAKIFLC